MYLVRERKGKERSSVASGSHDQDCHRTLLCQNPSKSAFPYRTRVSICSRGDSVPSLLGYMYNHSQCFFVIGPASFEYKNVVLKLLGHLN